MRIYTDSPERTEIPDSFTLKYGFEKGFGIPEEDELCLMYTSTGLLLKKGALSMKGDFKESLPRLKQSNLEHELLLKAAKRQTFNGTPALLDATAGLGEDSVILAAAGFTVTMFEYNPVIAALLEDALIRAREITELTYIIERISFFYGDSIEEMEKPFSEKKFNVILLDPMFPEKTKNSGVKKKFRLLHELESPCSDEKRLLNAALSQKPDKIIVKRPDKGPFLAEKKPDYSLTGKAVRYDCYINTGNIRQN